MIEIPTNCPECNSTLTRENDQLFCTYKGCSAQSNKKLLHFAKTLKIMGLGEKTIEKLGIVKIGDLYNLTYDNIESKLCSEKLAHKLLAEIEKSKEVSLDIYISALGIPLVGKSVSSKLSTVIDNLWDVSREDCKKAGIGEKATNNLLSWINDNKDEYNSLPIKTISNKKVIPSSYIAKVCITGKLKDFASRTEAKQLLESLGVQVMSSVSSNIDYLVCDVESSSSSYKKAKKLNKQIITMNNLLNIIKET